MEAPAIFNVEKLKTKDYSKQKLEDCYWPEAPQNYMIHRKSNLVHSEIIIIEGNYLLLKDEPWNQVRKVM